MAKREIMSRTGAYRLIESVEGACIRATTDRGFRSDCERSTIVRGRDLLRALDAGVPKTARRAVRRLLDIKSGAERMRRDVERMHRLLGRR